MRITAFPTLLTCALLASTVACSDPSPPRPSGQRLPLVDPTVFRVLGPAEDPFGDRLDIVDCQPLATRAEELSGEMVYAVDTTTCNYATVVQPLVEPLYAGDRVKGRIWHFDLFSRVDAVAHVAVRIGDWVLFEEHVPIPADGGTEARLYVPLVDVDRDVAVGTPVYFHIHNHGANEWALVELSALTQ